jgi:hypothetical protein
MRSDSCVQFLAEHVPLAAVVDDKEQSPPAPPLALRGMRRRNARGSELVLPLTTASDAWHVCWVLPERVHQPTEYQQRAVGGRVYLSIQHLFRLRVSCTGTPGATNLCSVTESNAMGFRCVAPSRVRLRFIGRASCHAQMCSSLSRPRYFANRCRLLSGFLGFIPREVIGWWQQRRKKKCAPVMQRVSSPPACFFLLKQNKINNNRKIWNPKPSVVDLSDYG